MPDTPNFAITYPCENTLISCNDFAVYATDVETALASVDAQALAVTQSPYAFANLTTATAVGVEAVMAMGSTSGSGVTIGATTFTIVTPGLYVANVNTGATQSTLTMTSQRVSVAVNGTNVVIGKWRGSNPADVNVFFGGYSTDLQLAVGDTVSFKYLWTGTGAIGSLGTMVGSISLLATP